ncbi:MAG: sarcosine oxidase subunit alpha [Methylobacterium sp.]|nr:MAG: sarcosine oxidase subunit alpha [Methylobacterium sp.]
MSGFRSESVGAIDRARRLNFTFDGVPYQGHPGDTLASALLANGVSLMGRSFKYHRPRGVLAAGAEEPNALVTVSRGPGRVTPNLRASEVELHDGLVATSQNRFPSLAFDLGAINARLKPLFPAGFYYKTFMGPALGGKAVLWNRLFEPLIRRAAGLGRPPEEPDPDEYASTFAHAEVLVIGSGEAGLRAAFDASANPATRVILCEMENDFGGWLRNAAPGSADSRFRDEALATLCARPNVRMLARTQAFGMFLQGFVALAERVTDHLAEPAPDLPRERLWQLRAGRIVLATGALERPLVFPDNDRPGILLASAAHALLARNGVIPGRAIAIATATDSAYDTAHVLREAGGNVVAILDLRGASAAANAARAEGFRVETGVTLLGTAGKNALKGVIVAPVAQGQRQGPSETLACDSLLVSGGFTPTLHLLSQARGKLRWDETLSAFVPGELPEGIAIAGVATGDFPPAMRGAALGLLPGNEGKAASAFVDFQNDVTVRDIRLATREGFRSIEHVKRYTTTGMATDQGKTSNIHALAIAAEALGQSIPETGHTTFRQPYTPVTFGTFAGPHRGAMFEPTRLTPMHDLAVTQGAIFEDIGQWKRAHALPRAGESVGDAVQREARMVRETVGLFDASTLGKIELIGRDAAVFLDRLYTNPLAKLPVGRSRYALMLNEAGFIIEDGIVARLGENRFHVTTTTGGAARVLHAMEDYRQTEFTDLDVFPASVTEHWAVIAVQGPKARETIAPFIEGIDLSNEAFPHMAIREGRFAGVPCRLMRASFTGELGYEVNVPAGHGLAAMEALLQRAESLGGGLYGLEAMHVLRAEKGYIIVGQETDGTVTPGDCGLDWAIGKTKPFFIGQRGLARPDLVASGRKQLVGLLPDDPQLVPEEGAQIIRESDPSTGVSASGHVTSAYRSPHLGRSFALGLLQDGARRHGETVVLPMPGGRVTLTVTAPVLVDPEGRRLHG